MAGWWSGRGQRLGRILGTILIVGALALLDGDVAPPAWLTGGGRPGHRPQVVFDRSVDAGFQTLALQTWDRFLVVFQARSDCFGDVRVQAAYALGSRAGYDPATATATIRVPGTPAKLQSALVHEWAHHVEFQCPAHQALRLAFLVAQGLPPDTVWRPVDLPANLPAGEWAGLPSEQYAEATVELVLGGRALATAADYNQAAVQAVAEWAASH